MPHHMAQRRDIHGLEVRRKQAPRLSATVRETQGAMARRLGVSRQSVMRWYRAWRSGGREALRAAGRAGRKPRLAPEQLTRVDKALREGPRAHGFSTGLWTLPRVALVIKRVTGVKYHPGHVWRLLGALDWTLQRPAKRAKERNETAIRHWVTTRWPAVKKTLGVAGPGSSSKTRAASRSGRPSAAHGPRAGRPPSSSMPSTGRSSPSPWAWRSGGTSGAVASSSRRGRAVTTTSRSSASGTSSRIIFAVGVSS